MQLLDLRSIAVLACYAAHRHASTLLTVCLLQIASSAALLLPEL
jgi:hypothetical protein